MQISDNCFLKSYFILFLRAVLLSLQNQLLTSQVFEVFMIGYFHLCKALIFKWGPRGCIHRNCVDTDCHIYSLRFLLFWIFIKSSAWSSLLNIYQMWQNSIPVSSVNNHMFIARCSPQKFHILGCSSRSDVTAIIELLLSSPYTA